jgi:hypothetical protein
MSIEVDHRQRTWDERPPRRGRSMANTAARLLAVAGCWTACVLGTESSPEPDPSNAVREGACGLEGSSCRCEAFPAAPADDARPHTLSRLPSTRSRSRNSICCCRAAGAVHRQVAARRQADLFLRADSMAPITQSACHASAQQVLAAGRPLAHEMGRPRATRAGASVRALLRLQRAVSSNSPSCRLTSTMRSATRASAPELPHLRRHPMSCRCAEFSADVRRRQRAGVFLG